jgi:hypothetical protein
MKRGRDEKQFLPYQSYLVRLWPTRREGVAGCRVSLERVADGQHFDFPDLDSLFVFLRTEVEEWGLPRPMSNNLKEPDTAYWGDGNK